MAVADVAITTVKPGRMNDALTDSGEQVAFYQQRGAVSTVSILYHAGGNAMSLISTIGHADLAAHGSFWEACMSEPAWMEMRGRQDSDDASGVLGSFQLVRSLDGLEPSPSGVGSTGWLTSIDVAPGRAQDAVAALLASKARMAAHGLSYSASMVLAAGFDAPGTRIVSVISASGVAAFGTGMEAALADPAVLEGASRLYGGADAVGSLAGRATFQRII